MEGGDDNKGTVNPFGLQDIISVVLALDPQERGNELQAEMSNENHFESLRITFNTQGKIWQTLAYQIDRSIDLLFCWDTSTNPLTVTNI